MPLLQKRLQQPVAIASENHVPEMPKQAALLFFDLMERLHASKVIRALCHFRSAHLSEKYLLVLPGLTTQSMLSQAGKEEIKTLRSKRMRAQPLYHQ